MTTCLVKCNKMGNTWQNVFNTLQNSSCTTTDHPSRKLSKLNEPDMPDTAGDVRRTHKQ